jgi:alpha-D-ribose 1-methylphosphonate 5-triphosphate synthase subunit PhnH
MMQDTLGGGFRDTARDSARAFRLLMEALARPGTIQRLNGATPPEGLSPAAGTALLTLADGTTPVFLAGASDSPALRSWIAFHIGAPLCGPEQAMFAIGPFAALLPHLAALSPGEPAYPDRSATVIAEVDCLSTEGHRLTGPGIKGEARLSLPEAVPFQMNARRFPLGFDSFLTCGEGIAALPRTTRVEDF